MQIPPGATSHCPLVTGFLAGRLFGRTLRHTVRPDGTRDWLLIYTLDGSGLYQSAPPGRPLTTEPHDLTLFRPGAFQNYRVAPGHDWDVLYSHFFPRPEWLDWLNWPEFAPGAMRLHLADRSLRRTLLRCLVDAERFSRTPHPRREALGLNALEKALLCCDAANPQRADALLDPRVQKAADFLCARLAEPFSEKSVGRAAGLSPSRLRHLFSEQMGCSPRLFLERRRMERARHLLIFSHQSISGIAAGLGYANPFYFTLRFTKIVGENPSAFRRRVVQR